GKGRRRVTRRCQPEQNIGHYRFLECSRLSSPHQPDGDIVAGDEIYFPFEPDLANTDHRLERSKVRRWREARTLWVEEAYECDAEGIITVTICNETTGLRRVFRIRQEAQPYVSKSPAVVHS